MKAPKKITALPTVTTIKNVDWFALVQDGVTSKVSFNDLDSALGDEWITGGTYNPADGCATFTSNSAHTFVVCGFLTGYTDAYTYTATTSGNSIVFDNTLFGTNYYNVDLTPIISGFTTGFTFSWCDPVVKSGNTSGCCIDTLWVSTISGCSPVTIGQSIKNINSTVEGISSIAYGQNTLVEGDNSTIVGGVSNQITAPSTYNSDNYTISFSARNATTIDISYTSTVDISAIQIEFINDYGTPILPTINGVVDHAGFGNSVYTDTAVLLLDFLGMIIPAGSGLLCSVSFVGAISSFFPPSGNGEVLSKARIVGGLPILNNGTGNGADMNNSGGPYDVIDVIQMVNGLLLSTNLNGVSSQAWNFCIPATSAGNMSGNDGIENISGLIQEILSGGGGPTGDYFLPFENIYGGTGNSGIIGGERNTINTINASIIGGKDNIVEGPSSSIIGSSRSFLTGENSVILGGDSISGTNENTVYVPTLNISTLCPASGGTYFNLLVDDRGYVVTGAGVSGDTFRWCDPVVQSGNTSGCCIDTLWVSAISGCSDLLIGTDGDIHLQTQTGNTWTGRTSVYINQLGQIGIGTLEPFSWTMSPMTGRGIEIHNDDSNNKIPLALTELGTQRWYIETDFADPNNPVQIKGSNDVNLMTWFTSSSAPRLGVGTTDPQGTFHLSRNGGVAIQSKYPDETNIVINNTSAGWTGASMSTPNKSSLRLDHTLTERVGGLIASVRTPEWDSFGPGSGSTTLEIWNASGDTLYKRIEIEPDGTTTISGNTVIGETLNIGNVLTTPPSYNLGIDSNGFVTSGNTGGGTMSFTVDGDNGTPFTITSGDTLKIEGSVGIDVGVTAIDRVLVAVDYSGTDSVIMAATNGTGIIVDGANDKLLLYDNDAAEVKYINADQLNDGGSSGFSWSDPVVKTGNTSGTCIDQLFVSIISGCSPVTIGSSINLVGALGTPGLIYAQPSGGMISGDINTSYGGHGFTDSGSPRVINKDGDESMGLCIDHPYLGALDYKNIGGRDEIFKFGVTTNSGLTTSFGTGESMGMILNSDASIIESGVTRSIILGGSLISATTTDTVYVPNLNIGTVGGSTPINNLGIDGDGNVVAGNGGINPYNDIGSQVNFTWDVSGTSTNYEVTLTGNGILTMSNIRDGESGNLIVNQDGVGGHSMTFAAGPTHYVVNGGGGAPTLTVNPNGIDILSFTYNGGSNSFYWTVGNDYTA